MATSLNSLVPPQKFPYINLLSLAFPVLMILNVLLCLWWTIRAKKRAILFIVLSLFLIKPTGRWLNWQTKSDEKANLKVVSLNIKGGNFGRKNVYEYLKNQNADIVFGQEYGEEYNVPGYPNKAVDYQIVAINSKLKIINTDKIATSGNGNSFYADIEVNGKVIRCINLYLTPFAFDKKKVKPSEDLETNKTKMSYILKRLVPTFKAHQQEVEDVRQAVLDSPYPVLLAGDFNAVPNSYEYYQVNSVLEDAFVKVGRGSSTSFHDYKFPIRIDYFFSSKEIEPITYRVDRSVKVSDHFPVIATFKVH
ncbi:endonuclease/exonuclease/phosphatase family protein [Kaistella solincola]|uniref:endonuclease/exonuclease/phosphatase family protein n=1 Tax=Kaistella solincola TaxID=510955 RepID=UPI001F2846FB|nr:endonuclease/exonuclease/phosphatase family protein [Kaistella solincola]